jgi:hypothetical protein
MNTSWTPQMEKSVPGLSENYSTLISAKDRFSATLNFLRFLSRLIQSASYNRCFHL